MSRVSSLYGVDVCMRRIIKKDKHKPILQKSKYLIINNKSALYAVILIIAELYIAKVKYRVFSLNV